MFRIGIDLGGTKIEGAILDENNIIYRKRIDTEAQYGYEHILKNIKKLYDDMVNYINNQPHTLGIGTPGAISIKTGLLKNSNTVCMNGKPFKNDIEMMLNRKIVIENDANCFALAEATMGAGINKRMVFGVIMGSGCGGGIVIDGKVWTGLQAIGGEWGHMTVDPAGPLCYCGKRGCVETFISGNGLQNRYFEKYGVRKSLKEIVKEYRNGETRAREFMEIFFDNFGRCLSNLINILDPDIVILGGGVSNIDELYTEGIKMVRHYVFSDSLETPIVKHMLGDSAGVIGAALIGI